MSAGASRPKRRYRIGPDIDLDQEVVLDAKGERITEERAREMAEYALRWAGRGRPSLTGERGRTPTLTVRVDASTRAALEHIAATAKKSLSEIAREALSEYVGRCLAATPEVADVRRPTNRR